MAHNRLEKQIYSNQDRMLKEAARRLAEILWLQLMSKKAGQTKRKTIKS